SRRRRQAARSPSSVPTSITAGPCPSSRSPSWTAIPSRGRIRVVDFVAVVVARGTARAPLTTRVRLLDDAAGDAIAGIAGRVGRVVVLGGVDHHGGAAVLKHGVGLALFQGDILVHDPEREVPV